MPPLKASAKPTQPPSGADFSALVKKVNELADKVSVPKLNATITGKIPAWKRWVGGEGPDYDGKGLRDVVNTNALYTDQIKGDLDDFRENNGIAHSSINSRLAALEEAVQHPPFPG
jgi:hypothetical protein